MDKRYQVFVSSTYTDLKEERSKVMQALMELDCIPAGMELFPSIDEEQFEFIKRIIDDCDYYILIIGGRYGSTLTDEGVSYTEKEYDYAIEKGIKVMAFIHDKPEDIPSGKSEKDKELIQKLDAFKTKASTGRLVKYWNKPDELSGLVILSLTKTKKMFPAIGWVKANIINPEVYEEVNLLRKEIIALKNENERLKESDIQKSDKLPIDIKQIAITDKLRVRGKYFKESQEYYSSWEVQITWDDLINLIIKLIGIYGARSQTWIEVKICEYCRDCFISENPKLAFFHSHQFELEDSLIKMIGFQLETWDLIFAMEGGEMQDFEYFWELTEYGKKVLLSKYHEQL